MSEHKIQADNLTRRGVGRPKGSRNKTTAKAKEIIEQTAASLGGAERLVEWSKEDPANERAFWATIFPKLMPLQVGGDPDNPIKTEEVGSGAAKLAQVLEAMAERKGE